MVMLKFVSFSAKILLNSREVTYNKATINNGKALLN